MRRLYSVVSHETKTLERDGDTIATWRNGAVVFQSQSYDKVIAFVGQFVKLGDYRFQSVDGATQYAIL
jgi:hypothetical protein